MVEYTIHYTISGQPKVEGLEGLSAESAKTKATELSISVVSATNPASALQDAINEIRKVTGVWENVETFQLNIELTGMPSLPLIRSIARYQSAYGRIYKSIADMLPNCNKFISCDRSACIVTGQLFQELKANFKKINQDAGPTIANVEEKDIVESELSDVAEQDEDEDDDEPKALNSNKDLSDADSAENDEAVADKKVESTDKDIVIVDAADPLNSNVEAQSNAASDEDGDSAGSDGETDGSAPKKPKHK